MSASRAAAGFVRSCCALLILGLLVACAGKPPTRTTGAIGGKPSATIPGAPRPGAYYKDDGPAAITPSDLDRVPNAEPRVEPLHRFANRPYNVFGVDYTPMTALSNLHQRGIASWYGRKFHGQKTAIGETYNMFAMTAAHPTAPLPCFARVTHAKSGRSVVVRINDRGPFHAGRIVDLSYAAAHRLGIAQGGSGEVELELLTPPFLSSTTPLIAAAPPAEVHPAPVAEPTPLPMSGSSREAFYVQLAAFGNFANAQAFQQRMNAELATPPRIQQVDSLFRVRLGPYDSREAAEAARDRAQTALATPLPIITSVPR